MSKNIQIIKNVQNIEKYYEKLFLSDGEMTLYPQKSHQ